MMAIAEPLEMKIELEKEAAGCGGFTSYVSH
jgi:hypothetical protein